jgi:hypothetical protein
VISKKLAPVVNPSVPVHVANKKRSRIASEGPRNPIHFSVGVDVEPDSRLRRSETDLRALANRNDDVYLAEDGRTPGDSGGSRS